MYDDRDCRPLNVNLSASEYTFENKIEDIFDVHGV